jgi:hypothetical protein
VVTNHMIATFLFALVGFFLHLLATFTHTMVTLLSIVGPLMVAISLYKTLYEMVRLSRLPPPRPPAPLYRPLPGAFFN